ncbi:MAG: hypothetical protein Tsb002_13300 [Wenzhouxiangellaceae bacterium]
MRFVQQSGSFDVAVGGRSGTPVLEMPNITKGNTIKVTVTFFARTGSQMSNGFYYQVEATNSNDVKVLSQQQGIVQGNQGWQATTKTVFFEAVVNSQTGVEDVDFQVIFSKDDLDGSGQIFDFLMTAEVVSLDTP